MCVTCSFRYLDRYFCIVHAFLEQLCVRTDGKYRYVTG